jgi:hypothetical protein
MIDLKYALTIEATEDPSFFGFYSTESEGFTEWGTLLKTAFTRPSGG